MPRDLFGDVTCPSITVGSRKWYSVPLSFAAHVALLVPVLLVPLLAADVLPLPYAALVVVAPPPTPPEPPRPPRPIDNQKPRVMRDAAPLVTPDTIAPESERVSDLRDPVAGGFDSVIPGGNAVVVGEPLPAPPKVAERPQEPLRAGVQIRAPVKVHDVTPVYPAIAQAARMEGTVILEAVIAIDGKVQNVRVLRSYALLDQAAIEAVRQWEYAPSTLNGVPVPVIMTVTVTFTLKR